MSLPPGPTEPSAWIMLQWLYRPLPFLDACRRRFGDTFTVRLHARLPPIVVVSHPDDVKEVFAASGADMAAGKVNATLKPFLGPYSLLMLDGDEHLRQRRLVLPTLHGERMHAFGDVMLEAANASIDAWPVGERFAVHPKLQGITLEVILRAIFGVDATDLADRRETITELLEVGAWAPLLIPYFRVDLGRFSPWGRFLRLSRRADDQFFTELARRRAKKDERRSDILAVLMEARDEDNTPLSDAELRDQLVTLLVAGHETTATALTWALAWIPRTPGLLPRLLTEISAARDPATGRLSPDRVARGELLDATVRETLRLQPVVPMVGRILEKPARIAGHDLPAGVAVTPSIYLAQRRPEAFPDPERFDPDRFLGTKSLPYEWFPFGGGIRRCVGMAFSLYEMKLVLAAILDRAKIRVAPGVRVRVVRRSITLSPSEGLPIIVDDKRPRGAPDRPAPSPPAKAIGAVL